jgi:hypothetical protein
MPGSVVDAFRNPLAVTAPRSTKLSGLAAIYQLSGLGLGKLGQDDGADDVLSQLATETVTPVSELMPTPTYTAPTILSQATDATTGITTNYWSDGTVTQSTGNPLASASGTLITPSTTGAAASSNSALEASIANGVLSLIGKSIPATTVTSKSPTGAVTTYTTSTGQAVGAATTAAVSGTTGLTGISGPTLLILGFGILAVILISKGKGGARF